jgi:hypothetical protein
VREAHRERRLLSAVVAPHLVRRIQFLFPLYEGGPSDPLSSRAGSSSTPRSPARASTGSSALSGRGSSFRRFASQGFDRVRSTRTRRRTTPASASRTFGQQKARVHA